MSWEEKLRGKDVNGMWEELKSVLDEMIEKYVPERRRRGMGKPKWLDEELAKLIERKKGEDYFFL